MATQKKAAPKTKQASKIDRGEDLVNFRYGLAIMKQNGDKAGLAKAKKEHPADWPNTVIRSGSPPKAAMFSRTQWSAMD